jgi:hypothetical protein
MIPSDFERAHVATRDVIPWLVNGRLTETEARQVEAHLAQCAECRADLEVEYRVLAAVRHRSQVEYAPQGSFQKLWSRIEDVERDLPSRHMPDSAGNGSPRSAGIGMNWRLAAAMLLGVGLGMVGVEAWRFIRPDVPAAYQTATATQPSLGRTAQIHAVFAPTVTIDELGGIVRGSGLAIVAGPSESGVYGLAAVGTSVTASMALERLRADPRVRFAELAQVGSTPVTP